MIIDQKQSKVKRKTF